MTTVVIVGASADPERVAYQALTRLLDQHYEVLPVNPRGGEISGHAVLPSLTAIEVPVDTLTMYVGPERQADMVDAIIALRPRRIIFNPGSENPAIYPRLRAGGIAVQQACTLVLLATRQFDVPV